MLISVVFFLQLRLLLHTSYNIFCQGCLCMNNKYRGYKLITTLVSQSVKEVIRVVRKQLTDPLDIRNWGKHSKSSFKYCTSNLSLFLSKPPLTLIPLPFRSYSANLSFLGCAIQYSLLSTLQLSLIIVVHVNILCI